MKIRFTNPCDEDLIKTRKVPDKGTTKKRVDFDENNWYWEFTQWDYYFILECINGKFTLNVTGGHYDDCYDYSETDVEVIQ